MLDFSYQYGSIVHKYLENIKSSVDRWWGFQIDFYSLFLDKIDFSKPVLYRSVSYTLHTPFACDSELRRNDEFKYAQLRFSSCIMLPFLVISPHR